MGATRNSVIIGMSKSERSTTVTCVVPGSIASCDFERPVGLPAAPEVSAAPAAASLNGIYFLQGTNGEQAVWTVTSCGPVCLHINSTGGWSENASLVSKGQYNFTVFDPNGETCPDGTKVAMTKTYVFDTGMTGGTRTVVRWDGFVGHDGGNELPPPTTFTTCRAGSPLALAVGGMPSTFLKTFMKHKVYKT